MKAVIYNQQFWVEQCDIDYLKKELKALLKASQFEILSFTEHYFSPEGYTAVWLLGESHLAIHTFPEENRSYIELSSCNQEKNEAFKKLLKQTFLL